MLKSLLNAFTMGVLLWSAVDFGVDLVTERTVLMAKARALRSRLAYEREVLIDGLIEMMRLLRGGGPPR